MNEEEPIELNGQDPPEDALDITSVTDAYRVFYSPGTGKRYIGDSVFSTDPQPYRRMKPRD